MRAARFCNFWSLVGTPWSCADGRETIECFHSRGQRGQRHVACVYWNKRKRLHKKRVELPQDWFGTPTWPPFHCFGTSIWPPWRHVKTLHTSIVWTHPDSNATLCNEFLGTTLSMICSGGHVRTAPTTTSTETWKKDIGQCDLYSYHLKYDHVSPKVRVQLLTEIWTGSSPV